MRFLCDDLRAQKIFVCKLRHLMVRVRYVKAVKILAKKAQSYNDSKKHIRSMEEDFHPPLLQTDIPIPDPVIA